ncbi:MAG: PEGA domain-containing protein [Polyangiaceae bacterium]|nr:PEGA domain-containing protein [Polyangiaceae bacterium]
MRKTAAALILALGTCLSSGALADTASSQVQVLAIASDKNFEHAQALTIALKRAVTRAEGWALSKGDYSLEVISLALNCELPPNDACQSKIGARIGSKRYIWGTLAVQKKEAVADLRLWEDGKEVRSTQLRYASNLTDPSDDTLMQVAAGGFAELMGATQGVLVVMAGTVSGEVFVDGEKVGLIREGRAELTVSPGEHKILVRAEGYNDAAGTVTVRPGASAEIRLNPTRIGGATGDPTRDTGGGMSTNQMIGYGGLAVGGVMALAGGYFWVKSYSQQQDDEYAAFQKRFDKDKDGEPCDYAGGGTTPSGAVIERNAAMKDLCDSNKTSKTLAMVLTPVGLVIAGVGTYFLVTDDSGKKSAKRRPPPVQPLVGLGPGSGELRLHVTF